MYYKEKSVSDINTVFILKTFCSLDLTYKSTHF